MDIHVSEGVAPKGRIIVRGYRAGVIERVEPYAAQFMHWQRQLPLTSGERLDMIRSSLARIKQQIDHIFARNALGIESVTDNLIMTGSLTGRDMLVQYLLGTTVYSGGLNYGALGTGSTTPAASDTQLTTESARVAPSIANDVANNEAQFQFYFPDANLANATYHEAGTFMNGTASANTGKIFNHALLGSAYTKTAGTDTTLEIDLTFT